MPDLLYTLAGRRWRRGASWLGAVAVGLGLVLAPTGPARAQLGLLKLLGRFLERPAPAPKPGPSAPDLPGSTPEAVFQQLLVQGDLPALNQACQEAVSFDFTTRLRLLQTRLVAIAPAPQPLGVVLVNANALLSCRAPDAALSVLNRTSPAWGKGRDQWLVLRWRAAYAGLHHALAADNLAQLAAGRLDSLEAVALPLQVRDDGSLVTRAALDMYAEHLIALDRRQEAAAALLAGRMPGEVAADRLRQAVGLLETLPLEQRDQLLERALDQAASAQSWGLAIALLEDQRRLIAAAGGSPERANARLLRLSQRVDDAYSEWQVRRQDPGQSVRTSQLQQQLRSPRAANGHASPQP
ncbi:MAG: hypothetical protein ACKOE9_10395 [Vulcanococcus sp.]